MATGKSTTIKSKLTRVLTLAIILAMAAVGVTIIEHQRRQVRRTALERASAIAGVLAGNVAPALSFRDAATAREILAGAAPVAEVLGARVYSREGQVFAEWQRPGATLRHAEFRELIDRETFYGDLLIVRQPVIVQGETAGYVCLQTSLRRYLRELYWAMAFTLGCMALASGVAWWLAGRLQHGIVAPLQTLARVADEVARQRNYAARAPTSSDDEIGTVTGAFNLMLEEIQKHQRELTDANEQLDLQAQQLRASEERFRQLAENIREVFWLTDATKQQMIYISPGYEAVWGRSCASLIREPWSWLDAVHPEDRERVRQHLPKQVEGTYDIEYRICRPSGSVRWIRDRAFPIRNADGQVYRVAGIAEDITSLKLAEAQQRLQAEIMRQMTEGVVLVRADDGRMVYVNPAFEQIFGYNPGELQNQPVAILNATSDQDPHARAVEIMTEIRRRGSYTYEVHNRRKDGREFWCRATATIFDHHELGQVFLAVQSDITEEIEAREKLRQAEEKYRLLVERVPAVTYAAEIGLNGRWLFVSPQIETLTGYTVAEWQDDPTLWLRLVHPDDRTAVETADELCRQTGHYLMEYRLQTRAGRWLWVRDEGVLIQHNPDIMQGVLHDISDRKAAEEELRESEQRYRTLVEAARDVIYTLDRQGCITSLNPVFEEITGWSRDEWVGQHFAGLVHPDDLPLARQRFQLAVRGASVAPFELRVRTRKGEYLTAELAAAPLMRDNQLVGSLGIARNVTERRAAEAAIREMRQRLQNIYDSSHDAIAYLNRDGQLVEFNRAFETLTGYRRDELYRMNYRDLTPLEYHGLEDRILQEITATGQSRSYEKEYRRKDGRRVPVSLTMFAVTDAAGNRSGLAAIIRDITLQRTLQRQILEISDHEQRRIGQDLHDGLCQELRGVAFAIKGLEQRLRKTGSPEADGTAQLCSLVEQITTEARNTARGLHPVELDAGGLLAALKELAGNTQAATGSRCVVRCDEDLPFTDAARSVHVYRIVQEALSNAVRHGQARQIGIVIQQNNGSVQLTITDDGRGLPSDYENRGGMGLNIMAYRARALGGSLQLQRSSSGGTIVQLRFPVT